MRAVMSAVNLAEVTSVLADRGVPDTDIRFTVAAPGVTAVPFDEDGAMHAGPLRPLTKAHGLSLGACLALARRPAAPMLTADRAWATLDLNIEVLLIR